MSFSVCSEIEKDSIAELLDQFKRIDKSITKTNKIQTSILDKNDKDNDTKLKSLIEKSLESSSNDSIQQPIFKRVETSFKYNKERFQPTKKFIQVNSTSLGVHRDTDIQYSSIYSNRLDKLRPMLHQHLETKLPNLNIHKILQLKPNDDCILIGTVYKEMDLKPNILKQYVAERDLRLPALVAKSYISDNDKLFFEDDTGRVKLLVSKEQVDSLLTGLIIAVHGKCLASDEFEVSEIILPGIPPQPFLPEYESLEDDVYVAMVSSLGIGNPNSLFQCNLLLDYLNGSLGLTQDHKLVSRISRLIIVGNSVHKEDEPPESFMKYSTKQEIIARQKKISMPIKEFDIFLSELCQTIPIDIIPGTTDPTNPSLPQSPLNVCLFPFTRQNTNFNPVSNPYESLIGGRIFLGTSGQNIDNAARYMKSENKIEILEKTLVWRHLAPTAPDTLSCEALDEDPFIIEQCPHVYFIGNQDQYESKLLKGANDEMIRVILIPKFSETSTIVLVNLKTLDTIPIQFDTSTFFPHSPSTN